MTQSANALDCHRLSRRSSRMPKGIECCDSRAKQWRSFFSFEPFRNRGNRFRRRNHVFGIAPVEADPGDLFKLAQNELSPPARITNKAMSAMPTHADSLPGFPDRHPFTNRVNPTCDFMPRNPRILNSRPIAFLHQHVTMAN